MMCPLDTSAFLRREPAATIQMRQVRVVANVLTKEDFLLSSFGCVNSRWEKYRGFAQSAFCNVENHDVAGGL